MCVYFMTEAAVVQSLPNVFFSDFDLPMRRILSGEIWRYGVNFWKRKSCKQNLTEGRKQPPAVMLHQVIFYKVFILTLRLKIIRSWCKLFYIPVAESASFPHQAKRVKTNLCITVYETLTCHVECFSFYKHSLLIL